MSDVLVQVQWEGGLRFEAAGKAGISIPVDGNGEAGLTPVELLAVSIGTCMGADIVDILARMRIHLEDLSLRVEGDRRAEAPRRYTAIRMLFETRGVAEGDRDKLQRAVDMSRDKYCSVLHTVRPDLDVSIRVESA